MPWAEAHRRACIGEAEAEAHVLDVYGQEEQNVIVGEWSLAVNHDAPLGAPPRTRAHPFSCTLVVA